MTNEATWKLQTQAFLEHLGCGRSAPCRLPKPTSAEWTHREVQTERMMFDVGNPRPFIHHNSQVLFDGREVYHLDQLRAHGLTTDDLRETGADVELRYDQGVESIVVTRRNITIDRLPWYVRIPADNGSSAGGPGCFRYHVSRNRA